MIMENIAQINQNNSIQDKARKNNSQNKTENKTDSSIKEDLKKINCKINFCSSK